MHNQTTGLKTTCSNTKCSLPTFDFGFVVRCCRCSAAIQLSLSYLGHPVRCPECENQFIAKDRELESAAMDEEVSEFARVIDWDRENEPSQFEPRPR